MRGKRSGSPVTLRLAKRHWPDGRPSIGDFLVTEAGSGYLILDRRGDSFFCVKIEPTSIPEDEVIWAMDWLPRGKKIHPSQTRIA